MIGISGAAFAVALQGGSTGVVTSDEDASREEVLEFWTPERVKRAKPAEMPVYPVECTGWGFLVRPHCW
ncbi:hypothetical protein ACIRQP_21870 [Streptomyces sp. NPDC102274]|uniref:hypothetical protein n=1 Tax=Streptomyces sp. NPDC102274 TaxID=3366151 RepID=UPI0038234DE2